MNQREVSDTSNYSVNYIYKCIKQLDKDIDTHDKLTKHIQKYPLSLYDKVTIFTPYIYAASINLNTLMIFHNIYMALYKNIHLPDVYIEPYLLKNKKGDSLLHFVVNMIIKNDNEKVESYSMLEYIINTINVNINDTDANGNTVLHLASKANKIDLVKLLLFNRINPNIKNNANKIALNYAVINKNKNLFKILLYKNSNYKYIKDEEHNEEFDEIIERFKKKVYRKIINTKKKNKSITHKRHIQARHVFLCNEISKKLDILNNDTQFINYTTELFNIAKELDINISEILYDLNVRQSEIEHTLNIYKDLCKKISGKIVIHRSIKN